jgi:Helix-turn-helix domain
MSRNDPKIFLNPDIFDPGFQWSLCTPEEDRRGTHFGAAVSIQLMSATWLNGPKDRSQRLLMLALADCASDQGLCWPSTQTLAKKACMDVRTVLRGLKALEQVQWLKITRRSHEHKGNTYELNLGRLNDTSSRDIVSGDNLSHDKTTPSHVTKRAKSHDISCNPPHPPIGRTIKNHKEPSEDLALRVVTIWNENCGELLPMARKLTTSRHQKVKTRCSEQESADLFVAEFTQAVRICASTPFLSGANDRRWTADLDWLIENDGNLQKVLEGKYGKSTLASGSLQPSAAEEYAAENRRRQMSVVTQGVANG